jgi:tetratricopeptide (TPR) repeat protein
MSEKEQAQLEFQTGQLAFERGQYRAAIEALNQAVALANANTPLGGEIQLWLVNAYAAVGQQQDAIATCQKLARHPDLDIRKQSKRLVYILQAPKLKTKAEWLTQIPDLKDLDGRGDAFLGDSRFSQPSQKPRRPKPRPEPEPINLSQVETKDNQFVWIALIGSVLLLGGLWWFS